MVLINKSQGQPRYLTGDLVGHRLHNIGDKNLGIIVSVRNANDEHSPVRCNFGMFVYYVFFPNRGIIGPLFSSELYNTTALALERESVNQDRAV